MSLLKVLSIADIYSKVCPPNQTLMLGLLRSTSTQFKKEIDNMSLEVHIKIKSYDIDNIIKNIKKISENYTITKIEFSKSYTILMIINLDIIGKLCPFLTHLDLGYNQRYNFGRFKRNLPKCDVIQNTLSYYLKEKRIYTHTHTHTHGKTIYYELDLMLPHFYKYEFVQLRNNIEIVLAAVEKDIPLQLRNNKEIVLAAVEKDIPLQLRSVKSQSEHKTSKKLARKARDYETKALSKRYYSR
jgi:hypothetical protein